MPVLPAFAVIAVLASGVPITPATSMYPTAEIVSTLPKHPWCSEWSQMSFKADGRVEMKDISGVKAGGPTEKPGEQMTGKWEIKGDKVHVDQGHGAAVVDLVALRDANFGMVLGVAEEYFGPCE